MTGVDFGFLLNSASEFYICRITTYRMQFRSYKADFVLTLLKLRFLYNRTSSEIKSSWKLAEVTRFLIDGKTVNRREEIAHSRLHFI